MKKQAFVYAAVTKSATIEVKAYSKSSAVKYMQLIDPTVKEEQVFKSKKVNSHQCVVGE